jgi:hypothetical protein
MTRMVGTNGVSSRFGEWWGTWRREGGKGRGEIRSEIERVIGITADAPTTDGVFGGWGLTAGKEWTEEQKLAFPYVCQIWGRWCGRGRWSR